MNLVHLAGAVRTAGYDVEIFDAMTKDLTPEEAAEQVCAKGADIVGLTAVTASVNAALGLLAAVKAHSPQTVTLLGGIHATYMFDEILGASDCAVDYIVRGEAEITLPELLAAIESGTPADDILGVSFNNHEKKIVNTPPRPLMEASALDELPMAFDLLDWDDYRYFVFPGERLGAVDTSRGCDKSCTFCSQQKFWGKSWRGRSLERVADEITMLRERFDVGVVLFTDDYPTLDRDRWEKLLDLLIERESDVYILMETRATDIVRDADILTKYRRAGIVHMYIGTEATDQATLDRMKKDVTLDTCKQALALLARHEILSETSMILGLPEETPESVEKTLALATEYDPDFCHFLAIAPWPYADLWPELEPYVEVTDYSQYNLVSPVVRPIGMTLEEVDQAIVDCYRRFYMGKLDSLTRGRATSACAIC